MTTSLPRRFSDHTVLVAILIAVSAVNPLAINIIVPSLPSIMATLNADIGTVQLALTVYLAATAVTQLFAGPLSDHFGRKPVTLAGLAIFSLASVVCALAPSMSILLLGRVLQGVGASTAFALGRAIVRDRYDRDTAASVLGYVTMGFAVAPMVGPLIGGVVDDHFGWRWVMHMLAVLGVIVTVATWFILPETRQRQAGGGGQAPSTGSLATLVRIPPFWAFVVTAACSTAVFFSFLGGTPFLASQVLGMSGTQYGLYFAFVSLGYIAGNFVTARFARKFGLKAMILAGNAVTMLGVVVMLTAFSAGVITPLSLFAPVYVLAFGNGLTMPNAIAGAVSVRPEFAGTASGLLGSLQIGAGAVATLIVGAVLSATGSAVLLSLTMLAFAASALAAGLWVRFGRM